MVSDYGGKPRGESAGHFAMLVPDIICWMTEQSEDFAAMFEASTKAVRFERENFGTLPVHAS